MTPMTAGFEAKIVDFEALDSLASRLARPLVFTNGVFDILHRGHATYLAQARALGASLVVAVNGDASVRQLGKGADRPINGEADRAALVAALQSVDLVTIFSEQVPLATLERVRPDIYVKGGDYDVDALPEAALVRTWGGRAIAIPFVHHRSTTNLLARVRSLGS
jgi:rfaE bifunctional protein nucleotidyltransferase chain/domain